MRNALAAVLLVGLLIVLLLFEAQQGGGLFSPKPSLTEIHFVANVNNEGGYMTLNLHLNYGWLYFEDDQNKVVTFRISLLDGIGRILTKSFRGEVHDFHITFIYSDGGKNTVWLKQSPTTPAPFAHAS